MSITNSITSSYLRKAGLLFAICFTLHSCIGEHLNCDDTLTADGEKAYFTVSIVFSDEGKTSQTTRATLDGGDDIYDAGYFFNYGIEEESEIATDARANWLIAYDASGRSVASLPILAFEAQSPSDRNSSKSYKAVCQVNPETLPVTRINTLRIVLNAGIQMQDALTSGQNLDNITLTQSEAGSYDHLFLVKNVDNTEKRYHTMSSSMVVKDSRTAAAITIGELKYYPTPQQALERPCATLYVERLQAKYTVLFHPDTYTGPEQFFLNEKVYNYNPSSQSSEQAEDNVIVFSPTSSRRVYYVNEFGINDDVPVVNRGYWKASITGWSINATEPSEYLFKSFGSSPSSLAGWNFTPQGISSPVRNLWTVDPNYSGGKEAYPDQYRPALDISTSEKFKTLYPYQGHESSYPLNYLSFRALSERHIRQYTTENTYDAQQVFNGDKSRLESRLQYRCGSHILVGSQLLIEGMDASGVYNPTQVDRNGLILSGQDRVKSKYFMNNIYWTEDAYINYYCKYLANHLDATTECKSDLTKGGSPFVPKEVFNPRQGENVFYVRDGNNFRKADSRDFTIQPVQIIGGDGWCYPVPNNNGEMTSLFVFPENAEPKQVKLEDYNKLAYGYPFYFAKGFTEGCMYYAVPVSGNSARETQSNFGLVTGDYGAVRNHWYHYRFTSLTSVGVPVHDPLQPIIPNNEPSLLGLGFEVRIIPWHVVEEDVNI